VDVHRLIWKQYGFRNLLGWLLIYLLIGPFLEVLPHAGMLVGVILSVVLFSAIHAVNRNSLLLIAAISLLVLLV